MKPITSKQLGVMKPNWSAFPRHEGGSDGRRKDDIMWWRRELDLEDMLADPIVHAVMQADHVDQRELDALLARIAEHRRGARQRNDRRVG